MFGWPYSACINVGLEFIAFHMLLGPWNQVLITTANRVQYRFSLYKVQKIFFFNVVSKSFHFGVFFSSCLLACFQSKNWRKLQSKKILTKEASHSHTFLLCIKKLPVQKLTPKVTTNIINSSSVSYPMAGDAWKMGQYLTRWQQLLAALRQHPVPSMQLHT